VPAGGVVRDDAARWQSVAEVEQVALALGCKLLGRAESELAGPSGNREIFVLAARVASQPEPAEPGL
jgi:predicted rRNA methylase YqxC with S4 and FtsJ domains